MFNSNQLKLIFNCKAFFSLSKEINTLFINKCNMVHLFGDWFGDIIAIFLCFVIYLFLRITTKEKKTWNRLDFAFSAIIFFISACQVIGSFVYGDNYYGPAEGFIISLIVMLITFGTGTLTAIELRADKK